MRVLVACEFSARVRDAFIARGHDAWSCDLIPSEGNNDKHMQRDALEVAYSDQWDMMIAFPDCTHLSASGARWWPEKVADGRQQAAIDFVLALSNVPIHRIAIENPIGKLSTAWRKPDQIIEPYMFGHGETKGTCLWLKNLPFLQPTKWAEGRRSKVHLIPGGPRQARLRSITYQGIADAMADQWGS